jgi:hypothetical protein
MAVALGWSTACSSGGEQKVVAGATATDAAPLPEVTTTTATEPSTTTAPPPPSSTTTTTAQPTSTTVAPTSTTRRPVTTTTTTFPAGAVRLTIRNEFVKTMDITVNGVRYLVAAGATKGPVPVVPAANHNDTYSIVIAGTMCGMGDGGPHFQEGPGTAVTLRVVAMGPESMGCPEAGPDTPNFKLVWEGAWSGGH